MECKTERFILAFVILGLLLLVSGCVKPVTKLGCCAKANISQGCVLLNMTTAQLMPEYIERTNGPCDNEAAGTKGHCNVTIGENTYLIPICTDAELNSCLNPDCTAMVCGDFLFKPKVAPGVIATEEGTAKVDVPPESEEEENTIGFYKAQCRFFPMDFKLRSIMKTTKSSINVFRIGVGGSFDEFDNYRYYFPLSDRYCNINPKRAETDIRVDRYMNYLDLSGPSDGGEYDPSNLGECMNLSLPEPPFRYGWAGNLTSGHYEEQYEYEFANYYKLLYPGEKENPSGKCLGGEQWSASDNYRKLDREFYRKWLTVTYFDKIYGTGRAPFECTNGQECYSGTCSFDFYSRGTNLLNDGSEFFGDCNYFTDITGDRIVVCSPISNFAQSAKGEIPTINYAPVTVNLAKISIELDDYDAEDIMEVKEKDPKNGCGDYSKDWWVLGCIGDCGDMGEDYRCELRREWCDFSGNDLGKYKCEEGGGGVLDFENDKQIVSKDVSLTKMPANISIEKKPKKECTWFYGDNDDTTEVDCPVLEMTHGEVYPPAGGFVFFGKDLGIKWKDRTVIGYGFVNEPQYTKFIQGCGLGGSWYDVVEIGPPNGTTWQNLMDAFAPMFEARMNATARELKGSIDDGELILSSMPWVLAYKRLDSSDTYAGGRYTISSIAAQKLRERNFFGFPEPNADGTSTAELDSHPIGGDSHVSFLLLYPKKIILFYEPTIDTLGSCKYDKAAGLPALKEYGWCEPCTISTLAYQNISAKDWAYMPMVEIKESPLHSTEVERNPVTRLCECSRDFKFGDGMGIQFFHNFTCFAPHITDLDEYNGISLVKEETLFERIIQGTGAARTVPEASLMKERLGDYMKAGVLPIIDMSDSSNWNKTISTSDKLIQYDEYDFERLFGDMGTVITIVDSVQGAPTAVSEEKLSTISERAAIIRTHCWRCLTAVRITSPYSDEGFNATLDSLFSDPALRKDIDIVAFDYSPPLITSTRPELVLDENISERITKHLTSLSRTVLQKTRKPSLVLNFYTTGEGFWNSDVTESLLRNMASNQDKLKDAGIIGIVWMPVRGRLPTGGMGIVDTTRGPGVKGEMFCAVQKGFDTFVNPQPIVIYSLVQAVESVNCTICTAYEKTAGLCNKQCENGIECTVPEGSYPRGTEWTCPTGIVLEPCRLCNETPGYFDCTYKYYNGSLKTVRYDSSYISSDLYMDVLAGLKKPNICCLETPEGIKYSYNKRIIQGGSTTPIVFPATGMEGASCGGGGTIPSGFCGMQAVPVRNYDVDCTFVEE